VGVTIGIVTFLLVFACMAMIAIILVQRARGGGLAGIFGGGGVEQAFGTRAATLAQKVTAVLGVLFILLTVVLGILYQRRHMASRPLEMPAAQPSEVPPQPPADQENN